MPESPSRIPWGRRPAESIPWGGTGESSDEDDDEVSGGVLEEEEILPGERIPWGCESSDEEDDDVPGGGLGAERNSFDTVVCLNASIPTAKNQSNNTNRTNWHVDHNKNRMDSAVAEFLAMSDDGGGNRGGFSRRSFAIHARVPINTFYDRLRADDQFVSPTTGRPGVLTKQQDRAVADAIARRDDHNRAIDTQAIIESLHSTFPQFTRRQLANHWHHGLKKDPGALLQN